MRLEDENKIIDDMSQNQIDEQILQAQRLLDP